MNITHIYTRLISLSLLLGRRRINADGNADFLALKSPPPLPVIPVIYHAHPRHQHTALVEVIKGTPQSRGDEEHLSDSRRNSVKDGTPLTDFSALKSPPPPLPVIQHAHPPRHQQTSLVEGTVQLAPDADLFNLKHDNEVESTGRLVGVQGGMPFEEEAQMIIQAHDNNSAKDEKKSAEKVIMKHGLDNVVRSGPVHPQFDAAALADGGKGESGNGAYKQYDDSDADANQLPPEDSQPEQMTREDEIAFHVGKLKTEMRENGKRQPIEKHASDTKIKSTPLHANATKIHASSDKKASTPTQKHAPASTINPVKKPAVSPPLVNTVLKKYADPSAPSGAPSNAAGSAPSGAPSNAAGSQPASAPSGASQPVLAALPGSYPGPPAAQPVGEDSEPMAAKEEVSMKVGRPKGWDQCLKFARYVKAEDVQGPELVRTWKATCAPAVQSGIATERYRLMCNALQGAVEPYAAQRDYDVEQLCDSVLAVFHDITASA